MILEHIFIKRTGSKIFGNLSSKTQLLKSCNLRKELVVKLVGAQVCGPISTFVHQEGKLLIQQLNVLGYRRPQFLLLTPLVLAGTAISFFFCYLPFVCWKNSHEKYTWQSQMMSMHGFNYARCFHSSFLKLWCSF